MAGISEVNPFVGPRSIQQGESLYGRGAEVQAVFDLLQARRIVLLHSPSGAGKSSLVQAGLIPRLSEARFDVWRPIRVNLDPRSLPDVPEDVNRYALSAMLSMEEEIPAAHRRTPAELAAMKLRTYLETRPRRKGRAGQGAVLLFDQFEEVLTVDTTAGPAKKEFFNQLGDALENRLYWALFIIREDFLGAMAPFRDRIPTQLQNTYRLDLLSVDGARAVAVETARRGGRTFPAADKLIRDLSIVLIQDADGWYRPEEGGNVEPVQLQVVCRRLWEAMPKDDVDIVDIHLQKFGDVKKALGDYYADSVRRVAGIDIGRERKIREWVGSQLIGGGTRAQVRMDPVESGGLRNELIEALRETYLIRAEQRAGSIWFELSHDRLVPAVKIDNEAWEQAHLHPLQVQARLWEKGGRAGALLLSVEAFHAAKSWLEDNQAMLSALDIEFLARTEELRNAEVARRAAERKAANRQRLLARVIAAVAGLALGAAVVSGLFYIRARNAEIEARTSLKTANDSTKIAQDALVRADDARAAAENSSVEAKDALTKAEEERQKAVDATVIADAERQNALDATAIANEQRAKAEDAVTAAVASARRARDTLDMLAVRDVYPNARQMRTFLADVSAVDATPGWRAAAYRALEWQAARSGRNAPRGEWARAVSVGSTGSVALGGTDGSVVVWDESGEARRILPANASHTFVRSIAVSPDGRWLLAAADRTTITDLRGDNPLITLVGVGDTVWSAAFSRNGQHAVIGTTDGRTQLWNTGEWTAPTYISPASTAQPPPRVWDVGFDATNSFWLAARSDGEVEVHDLTGRVTSLLSTSGPACQLPSLLHANFAPDRAEMLILGADDRVRIWNVMTQACTLYPASGIRWAAYLSSGGQILTLTNDDDAWVGNLDAESGEYLGGGIVNAAVGRDGRFLLSDRTGWGHLAAIDSRGRAINMTEFPPQDGPLRTLTFAGAELVTVGQTQPSRWTLDGERLSALLTYPSEDVLGWAPVTAGGGGTLEVRTDAGRMPTFPLPAALLNRPPTVLPAASFPDDTSLYDDPDGRFTVHRTWNGALRAWPNLTNAELREMLVSRLQAAGIHCVPAHDQERYLGVTAADAKAACPD